MERGRVARGKHLAPECTAALTGDECTGLSGTHGRPGQPENLGMTKDRQPDAM